MSGFAKAVQNEGFAQRKIRSRSLAIGVRSVLFPIERAVCVSGTLAIAMIDLARIGRLTPQSTFTLKSVGAAVTDERGYRLSGVS